VSAGLSRSCSTLQARERRNESGLAGAYWATPMQDRPFPRGTESGCSCGPVFRVRLRGFVAPKMRLCRWMREPKLSHASHCARFAKNPKILRLPWDFHTALSEERLRICACLLANARRDAVALAAFEMGDDNWSVGCRAYAFGKQRLKRLAESGKYGWLRVMDDSQHFVFLIDQIPVRFCRGLAEGATVRTLRRQEAEAEQLDLALGGDIAEGLVFRLAVEASATGGVERVVFLALRGEEGHAECAWPVPLDMPPAQGESAIQLRLIADDGYEGPSRAGLEVGKPMARSGSTGKRHRQPWARSKGKYPL
jgi:hypothetical protein